MQLADIGVMSVTAYTTPGQRKYYLGITESEIPEDRSASNCRIISAGPAHRWHRLTACLSFLMSSACEPPSLDVWAEMPGDQEEVRIRELCYGPEKNVPCARLGLCRMVGVWTFDWDAGSGMGTVIAGILLGAAIADFEGSIAQKKEEVSRC